MSLRNMALRRLVLPVSFLLLGIAAAGAHAMPGSSGPGGDAAALSQSSLACLVLDAQAPSRLKLSADQIVEWQRLQQQHAHLFGDRCQSGETGSVVPTVQTGAARAMQIYRKDFLDFLSSLSGEQRSLLEESARTRREGRAALEEKLIRHRLML